MASRLSYCNVQDSSGVPVSHLTRKVPWSIARNLHNSIADGAVLSVVNMSASHSARILHALDESCDAEPVCAYCAKFIVAFGQCFQSGALTDTLDGIRNHAIAYG